LGIQYYWLRVELRTSPDAVHLTIRTAELKRALVVGLGCRTLAFFKGAGFRPPTRSGSSIGSAQPGGAPNWTAEGKNRTLEKHKGAAPKLSTLRTKRVDLRFSNASHRKKRTLTTMPEQNDVAFLDDVLFAFQAHLRLLARRRKASRR